MPTTSKKPTKVKTTVTRKTCRTKGNGKKVCKTVTNTKKVPANKALAPMSKVGTNGGSCSATFRVAGSWATGYQAQMTVTAGSSPVSWSLSPGGKVTQVWGGASTSGASASGTVGNSSKVVGLVVNGAARAPCRP
ncbi:MAG: cellulose binding domain-containing protein [Kineosporiaceae bacterium]